MSFPVGFFNWSKGFTIAIDGPVCSGKGTIAEKLAKRVSAVNFYTGGMYRALGLKCLTRNISFEDKEGIVKILKETKIELKEKDERNFSSVFLDGKDVTEEILSPEIAEAASMVSVVKEAREHMVKLQRKMSLKAKQSGMFVVMEGRDIGTRVLRDADLKIFLTADLLVRAKRRYLQYKEKNIFREFEEVLAETKKRDLMDTTRDIDPLTSHPEKEGYFILDNSKLTIDETVNEILGMIKSKMN